MVESAYRRGWSDGRKYQQPSKPTPFPWVATILLLCSVMALPALGVQTFLSDIMRGALVVVAAAGVFFFGWLTASDVRVWMQERK